MAENKKTIKTLYERCITSGHFTSEKTYYKQPHLKQYKEVVDFDGFMPINEAIKKLDGKRELTGDEVKQYYDFASGTDNHGEIPFNRSSKNLDIAMLTEHIQQKQTNIKNEILEKQAEKAEKDAIKAEVAAQYTKGSE